MGLEIKVDGYQHKDVIRSHGTKGVMKDMKVGEEKKSDLSLRSGVL